MRSVTSTLLAACLAFGCGGGGATGPTAPPPVATFTSLDVAPANPAIAVGTTLQLSATPRDQSGQPMSALGAPSFSSSAPAVAAVTATGLVFGVAPGNATITATLTAAGLTHSATVTVTVKAPGSGGGVVITTPGVTFSPQSVTIAVGDTVTWQFSAMHNVTFNGAEPPGGDIPNTSSGKTDSRVFTAAGTYDYECTLHTGMTGRVIVQSGQPATYVSLSMSPTTPSIAVAGTVQLAVTPRDQNGSPLTGVGTPTFVSSAPATAAVTAAGLVTGVAAGTATITASLTANGVTHSATASVTVTSPQSSGATVTTPNRTFSPQTLTITVGTTVTWQIQETTHNVWFNGPAPAGGNIPDTPAGNAVSRTFSTAGTYDYECTRHTGMTGRVVVEAGSGGTPIFTSLRLTPASASLVVGATVQLTATPLDQYGGAMTGLAAPTFTSSAPGTATVSPSGLATGVAAGGATITASLTAAGVTHTATSAVTMSTPSSAGTVVTTTGQVFAPQLVEIAPGGTVTWQFAETTHNVTFKDAAPSGGNIPNTEPGISVSRTFPTAGDYDYECTWHGSLGMKGRVRVR